MILEKLVEQGLQPLSFEVHSDPEWSMMIFKPDEIYVKGESGLRHDPVYEICQPALVVVNTAGEICYWWSWSKLQAGAFHDGTVPNEKSEANPFGNTHDVRWRPVPASLLALLKSGASDFSSLRIENIGFPDGQDHQNVKALNPKL